MSVRVRLTLWYVVVLCLGLGVFAGAVLWQTDRAADTALDATLARRAHDVAADLRLGQPITLRRDAPDEGVRQPGDTSLWVRVLNASGQVVVTQGPGLPGIPSAMLGDTRAGRQDVGLGSGRQLRLLVLPIVRQGRRMATVQVITTTDALDVARGQLLAAMGLAGGLLVVIAALGGLALADRVLRPVDRITRLAASIGAGDLHRRVGDALGGRKQRADELGRLVATFDGMLARLEDAAAGRQRLTADVAHELGTPITTISSAAEIALRHPRSSDEYRVVLHQVVVESRQMGRLVDDLLLLARADAGRLPMEQELVELDEVCRQAVRAYEPLARERSVTLRTCLPHEAVLVVGDEGRLGQVLRNLLDNALRHTPAGGAVTAMVERTAASGQVAVRVRDTGSGIDPRERERIFERFHRVQTERPSDGQRTGSGLGLAICRAIVQAHGGHIAVGASTTDQAGAPDRGAEFVITLPAVQGGN